MSEHDALLAAVVADPAADLPRLVYADWCDENHRPERAEFIRLQVVQAVDWSSHPFQRGDRCRCHHCKLARRVASLCTKRRRREWAGAAFGASVRFNFYRGFVEWVETGHAEFLTHAGAMAQAQPIEEYRLVDCLPAGGRFGADRITPYWFCSRQSAWTFRKRGMYLSQHLDPVLWDQLSGREYADNWKWYDDEPAAIRDLRGVCLNYARSLSLVA